ncbi:MAG: hypothetical protein QXQ64_09780 [Candidatus Bathyarchaeia archaeon]
MIKLKQIVVQGGEARLVFEADGFPEGTRLIQVPIADIEEKVKIVAQTLGRNPTRQDYLDAVKKVIADLRLQRAAVPSRPDFLSLIDVDLEGEG